MAAPSKPWERSRPSLFAFNNPSGDGMRPDQDMLNSLHTSLNSLEGRLATLQNSANAVGGGIRPKLRTTEGPPPLPQRPYQTANSHHSRYGHAYSSPYNSYSHYSPFMSNYNYGNRYGYGYGDYGNAADSYGYSDNNFVQMAEESSRQAFGSIESIVQAFASVSMMLESTYHAVYSSFRAVLGVADHFSRLRVQITQILSTLAIVRTLHWLFRKALYMLGLIKENPATQAAWSQAMNATSSNASLLDENDIKRSRSSWPIIMYFGVVFGAPWLIWKLLSAVNHSDNTSKWMTRDGDHYIGVALYNFQAEGDRELSLTAGQEVVLAPKALQPRVRGWLRASLDGKRVGLVPANYLRIQGFRRGVKQTPPADCAPAAAAEELAADSVVEDVPAHESESSA